MGKRIELPCYGIIVTLIGDGGGAISFSAQNLLEVCTHCNKPDCCYTCDESSATLNVDAGHYEGDPNEDVAARLQYNGAIDGITSMILAHACAGIDIESPAYLEGIETAIEQCGNNI